MKKPVYVFSNLAISVDGKIATFSRERFPIGSVADRKEMQRIRKLSDAVLFGASTLRTHRKACIVKDGPSDPRKQPWNVIVSRSLEGIDPKWPFFTEPRVRRILFITGTVPKARLAKFEKTCEVVPLRVSKKASLAREIMKALSARGIRKLLVEGGGEVMWEFAKEDLIDRYYVTVVPRVIGGKTAPTMVEGEGFDPAHLVNLRLKSLRRLKDEIFLVYEKGPKRGKKHPTL